MRSKTSSFDKTVFKKNLTRFAPVWAGYLGCLLLGMVMLLGDEADFWRANSFASLCGVTGVINFGFAFAVAAFLFGDLFSSRMCNALHAMPMTRECWFNTHLVTGLLFSLVPTTVMALLTIPLLAPTPVEKGWCIGLYWLAVSNLQYLFFFGLATLCAFCVGSRVGLAGLYMIVNFASFLALALVSNLYVPMHHGVVTPRKPFDLLSPYITFLTDSCYVDMRHWQVKVGQSYVTHGSYVLDGESWRYLFIAAAMGLVFLLVARRLYRKRDLECAGDLLAFRKLAPVFTVVSALTAAVVFMVVYASLGPGMGSGIYGWMVYVFLFLGLAVGWFAAQMLIDRSLRVFRRKACKGLAVLAAVLGISLVVNHLDPLNIEGWVPEAEEVSSVLVENSYRSTFKLEDAEDIQEILDLHRFSAQDKLTDEQVQAERTAVEQTPGTGEADYPRYLYYTLEYTLKNGWTSRREYRIRATDLPADTLRRYTSTLEALFYNGRSYGENGQELIFSPDTREELLAYAQEPLGIEIGCVRIPREKLTEEVLVDLMNAIADDCEAGTLSQEAVFHPYLKIINRDSEYYGDDLDYFTHDSYSLDVTLNQDLYFGLSVYEDSENILAWAENLGITRDEMIRKTYYVTDYDVEEIPFPTDAELSQPKG